MLFPLSLIDKTINILQSYISGRLQGGTNGAIAPSMTFTNVFGIYFGKICLNIKILNFYWYNMDI